MISLPWKQIGALCIVIAALAFSYRAGDKHGFHKRAPEVAALTLTIANMRAASAQAEAANKTHVLAENARNAKIQKEAADAVTQSSADARAAVRDYIMHHPAQAAIGNAGAGGLPISTPAAGATSGAGQMSVVDAEDLLACTDAVVVALGWQRWWGEVGK